MSRIADAEKERAVIKAVHAKLCAGMIWDLPEDLFGLVKGLGETKDLTN